MRCSVLVADLRLHSAVSMRCNLAGGRGEALWLQGAVPPMSSHKACANALSSVQGMQGMQLTTSPVTNAVST